LASIYIHIPYCKQACHYCNFYFSTKLKTKSQFLSALEKEIILKQKDIKDRINSIYIGGGTPSVLCSVELEKIIANIKKNFNINNDAEITIEINPDDYKNGQLDDYKKIGFNRLSVGVQSFNNKDLKLMNRRHNASQAILLLEDVSKKFKNFSIDLIYGIPGSNIDIWKKNIQTSLSFSPSHISAYALTIEKKTVFFNWIKNKKLNKLNENTTYDQFEYLVEKLEKSGFEHYEISNFAKNKKYSICNKSYWNGNKYFGFGPSAHSFDGKIRSWNKANIYEYITSINDGKLPDKSEKLTKIDRYNEHIMFGLRTNKGISKRNILDNFGLDFFKEFIGKVNKHLNQNNLFEEGDFVKSSRKSLFIIDGIISDFFIINE
tara:strand:+ start:36911 stop:38038 length:1128 start_codon:yes stop_codon:yes gene_type:complete